MNSTLFKNIVNGDFYDSNSTELIEIRSPLDSSVLGKVQAMSQDDVDIVMSNSKEAQKSWMKTTISKRAEILYKTAELLLERKDEIAKVLVMEIAKDEKSAMSEVVRTADFLRFTADAAKSIEGESIPSDSFPGFDKRKISFVTREPLGVVLAI